MHCSKKIYSIRAGCVGTDGRRSDVRYLEFTFDWIESTHVGQILYQAESLIPLRCDIRYCSAASGVRSYSLEPLESRCSTLAAVYTCLFLPIFNKISEYLEARCLCFSVYHRTFEIRYIFVRVSRSKLECRCSKLLAVYRGAPKGIVWFNKKKKVKCLEARCFSLSVSHWISNQVWYFFFTFFV